MEFDRIRQEIQKYKFSGTVKLLLDKLITVDKNTRHLVPFWEILVLLKWVYTCHRAVKFQRTPTQHDLNRLLKLTETFGAGYDKIDLTSHKNVQRFFRIISYQQFVHQEHYSNAILQRQVVLYLELKSNFNFTAELEKHAGLSILDFLKCSYVTYLYLHFDMLGKGRVYNGRLNTDYFDYINENEKVQNAEAFLSILTIRDTEEFKTLHRMNKEILQLYETNLFLLKPFLLFDDEYRVLHRSVFLQTLSHFIYNFLKTNSPGFAVAFGNRLERYVELGLQETQTNYMTAGSLKDQYGSTDMIADFWVGENLLIEVKATELHARSGVSRTGAVMQEDLKSSIVKAYTQLLSTAQLINSKTKWYGLIITYKEMYLGVGEDAWYEFLKTPVEEFIATNNLKLETMLPSMVFIISIKDWDWMIQAVKNGTAKSIQQILDMAAECHQTRDPARKLAMMEQVLRKYFYVPALDLSYLLKAHRLLDIISD